MTSRYYWYVIIIILFQFIFKDKCYYKKLTCHFINKSENFHAQN